MNKLALIDGVKIAYQRWGKGNGKQVLLLHGWLDNSNTFNTLGPYLAGKGFDCVALDHVGHGLSSHLPPNAPYFSIKAVSYVREFIQSLEMNKCHLVGHSMGANISFVYAGCFPETIDKLVMIDGFGPPTIQNKSTRKNLRNAIESAEKLARKITPPKLYNTLQDAVTARIHSVTTYPGEQSLSVEAAASLVGRGTYLVDDPESEDMITDLSSGPVRFRHDPRLVLPTLQYHTAEQVLSYADGIEARTLLISAEKGWPAGHAQAELDERRKLLADKGLLTFVTLPGSHHLHLDPDSSSLVASTIGDFLLQTE